MTDAFDRLAALGRTEPDRSLLRQALHYHVDLGVPGAMDFLPTASFDAIHESRLFGSPEFRSL